MPHIIALSNINNLVSAYESGMTLQELMRKYAISKVVAKRLLREAGITLRSADEVRYADRAHLPHDAIVAAYNAGESELALSKRYGVNRWTITRILEMAGVQRRSISDSMFLRMARMSPEERQALSAPAHAAATGRSTPLDERCRQAISNYANQSGISEYEAQLADWLRAAGIALEQQFPVGPYNLDIALHAPPVAVEVFGGHWHAYGRHAGRFHKRVKYLLNHGWAVLIIWVDTRHHPLGRAVCDNVLAFADELRSNPTLACQYRVICGDGQPAPATSLYFNDPATIERFCASD